MLCELHKDRGQDGTVYFFCDENTPVEEVVNESF